MTIPTFLGLAFTIAGVGFAGGVVLASSLLDWYMYRQVFPKRDTRPKPDNADKNLSPLRKRVWRGQPFRVELHSPDVPAYQAPDGAKGPDHE